nr:hypothetical protein [Tanacetum cinerariifolium]
EIRLLDHGRLTYRCDSRLKGEGRGSPGQNKTPGPWSARIAMWKLFKGLGDCVKITKKQSKPSNIEHEIAKNAQKPDQRTFSVQVKPKVKELQVQGPILPIFKVHLKDKVEMQVQGPVLQISQS